jgi:hypothetical protein
MWPNCVVRYDWAFGGVWQQNSGVSGVSGVKFRAKLESLDSLPPVKQQRIQNGSRYRYLL